MMSITKINRIRVIESELSYKLEIASDLNFFTNSDFCMNVAVECSKLLAELDTLKAEVN